MSVVFLLVPQPTKTPVFSKVIKIILTTTQLNRFDWTRSFPGDCCLLSLITYDSKTCKYLVTTAFVLHQLSDDCWLLSLTPVTHQTVTATDHLQVPVNSFSPLASVLWSYSLSVDHWLWTADFCHFTLPLVCQLLISVFWIDSLCVNSLLFFDCWPLPFGNCHQTPHKKILIMIVLGKKNSMLP